MDIYKVQGVSHLPMEYQEEYVRLISWERKTEKYVKNKSGIVTVKQVRLRRFQKIWYPVFKVQRRDLTECEFSEADFQYLNVDDIEYLYHLFRNMTIGPENIISALEVVKRFMRRHVNYTYFNDFQHGIETNQKRVNMTKPNQELENIDSYDFFMIIEKPELGLIYKNGENKKRFLRISEIAKFLDGTIKVIKLQLNQRFKENEKKVKQGEKGFGKFDRLAFITVLDALEDIIHFRRGIRIFKSLLGIRQGSYSRWGR
ncbi:hypothetical protein L6452_15157 [Arctium lappa]|uniref:Uncharacterized protein n=1 Tax=Arctium lappa TaxID=4217 RepID=A0ACB9CN00_ARCLA|nr:hypothetical protein L6452_15157 [Arctium lappa]